MTASDTFPLVQYAYAVLGIVISVVLPLLRKRLPTFLSSEAVLPPGAVPASVKTYLVVGTFSLVTAVLIVAFGGSAVSSWQWYTAILAGYAWDSTLQKIGHG